MPWEIFINQNQDFMIRSYDIVLFLAVYQHLPINTRDTVLDLLLSLSNDVFAIRTPDAIFRNSGLHGKIVGSGFVESGVGRVSAGGSAPVRLYRREISKDE